ncbi:MAG: hypothetical protein ACE5K7_06905, partial [Phycisphaerae bacterium]
RQTRRLCVIHFQGCWTNSFIELRRLICRGQLGQIRSVRYCGRFRRTDAYYSRNTWAGRLRLDNRWILDGTINNPFAHQVNAALHLASTNPQTPATPRRVRAELYRCRDIEAKTPVAWPSRPPRARRSAAGLPSAAKSPSQAPASRWSVSEA